MWQAVTTVCFNSFSSRLLKLATLLRREDAIVPPALSHRCSKCVRKSIKPPVSCQDSVVFWARTFLLLDGNTRPCPVPFRHSRVSLPREVFSQQNVARPKCLDCAVSDTDIDRAGQSNDVLAPRRPMPFKKVAKLVIPEQN